MGGEAPVNWDEVEVPNADDAAAQAAVEGTDVEGGLSESFDSAVEVTAVETEAPAPAAASDAPVLII